jgi:myo-inositol-1(or 4)-monophosphatase
MNKRPKSREETPKEGSDSARRYRTATICEFCMRAATAVTVIDFTAFIGRLATASGETILPFFRTSLSIDNKSTGHDFDPVTEADRAAEAVMRRLIKANFPQHGIVGEEFGNEREDAEYVWVLDPIDGTKSFIAGFPIWGTLIALLHKGTPVFGMMHQPFIGERFSGDSGSAHIRDRPASAEAFGAALRVAEGSDLLHHQPAADERRRPRRLRPGRGRGAADALWRRLLFLLHAGRRPSRSRGRDRAETLRHRGLIPIITGAGGVVTTWEGKPAQNGGRIIAAGDPACMKRR